MKTLVVIPAKGNSKRLPKKNIYEVNGKPMIHWAIKACEDTKYDLDVWVNTDSDEVEDVITEDETGFLSLGFSAGAPYLTWNSPDFVKKILSILPR